LEFAHNAAVEAADIAADEAYVKVFHATYEKTQRQAYDRMAPPSLIAHYEPKDRSPDLTRINSADIDPNRWYELLCTAQNRNEELFWRALKPFGNKDLSLVDELLEKGRVEAVEAASIVAELAYICAFNEAYDRQYQITWEECGILSLASEIIHSKEFRKRAGSRKKSIS
jgi:hypothetical protein